VLFVAQYLSQYHFVTKTRSFPYHNMFLCLRTEKSESLFIYTLLFTTDLLGNLMFLPGVLPVILSGSVRCSHLLVHSQQLGLLLRQADQEQPFSWKSVRKMVDCII